MLVSGDPLSGYHRRDTLDHMTNTPKRRPGRPPILDDRRPRELNHVRLSDAVDDEVTRYAKWQRRSRQAIVAEIVEMALMDGPIYPTPAEHIAEKRRALGL